MAIRIKVELPSGTESHVQKGGGDERRGHCSRVKEERHEAKEEQETPLLYLG